MKYFNIFRYWFPILWTTFGMKSCSYMKYEFALTNYSNQNFALVTVATEYPVTMTPIRQQVNI